VSGFLAGGEADIDELAQGRLVRFPVLAIFDRRLLEQSGFEVVATFRSPHVTIAFTGELAVRLDELWGLKHQERPNPYHGDDSTEEVTR